MEVLNRAIRLINAVKRNDMEMCAKYVSPETVNYVMLCSGPEGQDSPLYWVLRKNRKEMMRMFLENGLNLKNEGEIRWNFSPLDLAARYCDVEMCAMVYDENNPGFLYNPFCSAAIRGEVDICKLLYDKTDDDTRQNGLSFAVRYNKVDVVDFLVGKNPSLVTKNMRDLAKWSRCRAIISILEHA